MSDRMSPVDAAWLHMDQPTNLMVITSVVWFDQPVDASAITDAIRTRVVDAYPRFRQRVVDSEVGRPRWVDDPDFDLSSHLHHVALPHPGDDAALRTFVGEVMGQDLDRRRPLWQAWIVDGYRDGAAVVQRIHHCMADGISLGDVLMALVDDDTPAQPPVAHPDGLRRVAELAHAGLELATHPTRLAGAARTGARILDAIAVETLTGRDAPTALRGPQSGRKVVAWSDPLDLAEVKRIARDRDATVNDVLMAALSGAIGRYLDDVGTPAERIRAMVPVSMRAAGLPVPSTLGNDFALVLCPLPVGERDPDERLRAVRDAMDAIKGSAQAVTSLGLLAAMGLSPRMIEGLLVGFYGDKASLVLTNVPGPRHRVSVAGHPVAGILSWAPQSGSIGTSATIFSYAGQVFVGICTDPAMVPDPDRIAGGLLDEIRRLATAEVP
ncbi:wax ester/triacylglycerol synthase family O-acyltransferase [Euzebya sp.]|uniref:wax ester/triacylglycerol synthase family O-acyltransferase n=1 Tax=Euzebya sp. TaxID=1971409 RepID=UPI0035114A15